MSGLKWLLMRTLSSLLRNRHQILRLETIFKMRMRTSGVGWRLK